MDKNELWLSFVKSGSVKDFLSYIDCKKEEGDTSANNNGRTCNKGNNGKG